MMRCLLLLIGGLVGSGLFWGILSAGQAQDTPPSQAKSTAPPGQPDAGQVEPDPDRPAPGQTDVAQPRPQTTDAQTTDAQPQVGDDEPTVPLQLPDDPQTKQLMEKISYIFGLDIGRTIKARSVTVDRELFMRGLEDGIAGNAAMTQAEIAATLKTFNDSREADWKRLGERNRSEAAAFLVKNKKNKGVKTLESGLQYKVLKTGKGPRPTLADTVTVHYSGRLLDGTEFESSFKKGKPATLPMKNFIPGWKKALPMMQQGSRWELWVPAELAYGVKGLNPHIGPYATLVYEIELVDVKSGREAAAAP